ncbi:hypothetical protein [Desulfosarcina cetonica]|uniref:hypothetical protein n=1 Tax=Desulfosarcina cetonica TaxID=90730 RepID=UPI0006D2736A|nr:hypothetical protein [Desulfosarcina cetonica]
MYKNVFYPLRACVGEALEIKAVKIVDESSGSRRQGMTYESILHPNANAIVSQAQYASYLPSMRVGNIDIRPGEGMDTLPISGERPFPILSPVVSLFALAGSIKTTDLGRSLSVTMRLRLGQKALIGGLCLAGFPYLPFNVNEHGENSANFGLPREIRITAISDTADSLEMFRRHDFIDAEVSTTRQQIVSHSKFHYIKIDPTYTDTIILYFSDFPEFLTGVKIGAADSAITAGLSIRYGFIIPQLYVYAYREQTRYRPPVPFGLLGLGPDRPKRPDDSAATLDTVLHRYASNFLQHSQQSDNTYIDFTAASLFGASRQYVNGRRGRTEECFISKPIKPGESIVMYVEQAEDHLRCIAGLKALIPFVPGKNLNEDIGRIADQWALLFPNSTFDPNAISNIPRDILEDMLRQYVLRIPENIDFCEKLRIRVFELDPLDGVSPLKVPLGGKHARLLADVEIDELSEILLTYYLKGIRFRRASTAAYFAIEWTNADTKPGQLVVKQLEFIQSAHVSLHPRVSRKRIVKRLRYRLIGKNLAEDYAALGQHGFNFSIERQIAGGRKFEIFRANSLLDLIQDGAAKLMSNTRTRAVEEQLTQTVGGAKDNHTTTHGNNRSSGWRKSETGSGITGSADWQGDNQPGEFDSFSNQETRQHTEVLSPIEENNHWRSNAMIGNVLYTAYELGTTAGVFLNAFSSSGNLLSSAEQTFLGPNSALIPTYENNRLYSGFVRAWRGLSDPEVLKVHGMTTVNSSPFGYNNVTKDLLDLLDALSANDLGAVGTNLIDLFFPFC